MMKKDDLRDNKMSIKCKHVFRRLFGLSRDDILVWDEYQDYRQLANSLYIEIRPQTVTEYINYWSLVNAYWRKHRIKNMDYDCYMEAAFCTGPSDARLTASSSEIEKTAKMSKHVFEAERAITMLYAEKNVEFLRSRAMKNLDPTKLISVAKYEALIDREIDRLGKYFDSVRRKRSRGKST